MSWRLLARSAFQEGTFQRDGHRCVVCKEAGQDAHHILERRLWTAPSEEGGYFLENGATLCGKCHMEAEKTTLSVEAIRQAAGITSWPTPEHLYQDIEYDKWGNICVNKNSRIPGELFDDESVQKVLADVMDQFNTNRFKYPRTYHLPWSNPTKDDRTLSSLSHFEGKEVVVTEKMDGENTSIYRDYIHARSLEKASGEDRSDVWKLWSGIGWEIPEGWRLCGENLKFKHSIHYTSLPDIFMLFSVWDRQWCLDWDTTVEVAQMLKVATVPVLYRGVFDAARIQKCYTPREPDAMEGYVVRLASGFSYSAFRNSVAKYVRVGHVTTDSHWRFSHKTPNLVA